MARRTIVEPLLKGPHYVGATGEPAFENSWANAGSGVADAAFFKDADGFVHLQGRVDSGSGIPTDIFSLPAGFLPHDGKDHDFVVTSNGAYGRARVMSDGDVVAQQGSTTWFSLGGISFYAG